LLRVEGLDLSILLKGQDLIVVQVEPSEDVIVVGDEI
jgi:hypothetical protein